MATRFYLSRMQAAAVSPAFAAEWENTAVAGRNRMETSKTDAVATTLAYTVNDSPATSNRDVLIKQYVSDPIAAGPIAGTLLGVIGRVYTGSALLNVRSQCLARVVSNDGATVRGTLYAGDLESLTGDPSEEWVQGEARLIPRAGPVALSSVVAQADDRVVVELGYRKHSTQNVFSTGISLGEPATDALADLSNPGSDVAPWVEFSEDLFTARGAAAQTSCYLLF